MKLNLETTRLLLRPWKKDDALKVFSNWMNDIEVSKFTPWAPHKDVKETKKLISSWIKEYKKKGRINFAIELKSSGELIGSIEVAGYLNNVPIINYDLAKKYWNNGYMTEACRCLIDYLFSLGYKQIRIDAMPENIASIRVIEKCGGVFIGQELNERPLKGDKVIINKYIVEMK